MEHTQYADLFLAESREHVSAINHALLELERDVDGPTAPDAVSAIFRAVHTIKGMSAMMGYAAVSELAHELETILDHVRRSALPVDGDLMDLLFRATDVLEGSVESAVAGRDGELIEAELLEQLRAISSGVTRLTTEWRVPAPEGHGTLVRVRLAKNTPLRGVRAYLIVHTAKQLGEVAEVSPSVEQLQAEDFQRDFAFRLIGPATAPEIERLVRSLGDVDDVQIGEDLPPPTPGVMRRSGVLTVIAEADDEAEAPRAKGRAQRHIRIDLRRLDNLMNLIGELVIARGRLASLSTSLAAPALDDTVAQASQLITELRNEITASRLVPAWQVFDRFPRVVRDAARALGKEIAFFVEGRDIELDRSMLDEIGDSIIHLLRNAVDHGIESPGEREALGKPATGQLTLSAARDRSAVVIKVSDDGRGIDRARVLERAKADGLVEENKSELTEDELLRLLARPGFSTADEVTDLSGRGVGVDAVYTRVRALGGAMDIRSVPGEGTTIVLRLPLTLAIVRALLARVAGEIYAIPMAHVSESVELADGMVRTVKGREVFMSRDDVLPLLRLRGLVGLDAHAPAHALDLEQAVVIDLGDRRACLVVDELTGQEEIVVKPYDAVKGGLPIFGGATVLSDGSPSLMLDVSSLM